MNEHTWKAKRNHLCALIKKLSTTHGGDDPDWLRDYARELIVTYKDDLDIPVVAFQSLTLA